MPCPLSDIKPMNYSGELQYPILWDVLQYAGIATAVLFVVLLIVSRAVKSQWAGTVSKLFATALIGTIGVAGTIGGLYLYSQNQAHENVTAFVEDNYANLSVTGLDVGPYGEDHHLLVIMSHGTYATPVNCTYRFEKDGTFILTPLDLKQGRQDTFFQRSR